MFFTLFFESFSELSIRDNEKRHLILVYEQ